MTSREPIRQVDGDVRNPANCCPSCGNSYHRGRKCTQCGNVIPREIADPDASTNYRATSQPAMARVWSAKKHKYVGAAISRSSNA